MWCVFFFGGGGRDVERGKYNYIFSPFIPFYVLLYQHRTIMKPRKLKKKRNYFLLSITGVSPRMQRVFFKMINKK